MYTPSFPVTMRRAPTGSSGSAVACWPGWKGNTSGWMWRIEPRCWILPTTSKRSRTRVMRLRRCSSRALLAPLSEHDVGTNGPPGRSSTGQAATCSPLPPIPPIPLCGSHALHHACVSCAFLYCQKGTARPLQRSRTDSLSCVRKHGTCVGLAQLPFSCAERVSERCRACPQRRSAHACAARVAYTIGRKAPMLYDSMFSWGHILQAFWRDTAAFVEAQERQSRQDFAHWMELWTAIVHNLTYSGRLPWAGSLELAEWSRTAVEQDAAALLAVGSQCTEILDRLGQLERQIKGVEERLDLL